MKPNCIHINIKHDVIESEASFDKTLRVMCKDCGSFRAVNLGEFLPLKETQ